MPIRTNGLYNDPGFAQAAQNLAGLFAPPSGQSAAAWAAANAKNAEAARIAELYAQAKTPDEKAVIAGSYDPTNSWRALEMGDATKRYGVDQSAAAQRYGADRSAEASRRNTADEAIAALERERIQSGDRRYGADRTFDASRLNNADDNTRALATNRLDNQRTAVTSLNQPLNPGQIRPEIPAEMAGRISLLPEKIPAAMGAPKPFSMDEVKAAALESLQRRGLIDDREFMASIMGDPKLEQVQGPDGPIYARAIDAVGQRPAADVGKQGEHAGKIRSEIVQLPAYKNYAQAAPIYSNILSTADRNTKASDLNIVYSIGKLFDPTSVVREGEQIAVRGTAALPDWLQGAIAQLNGGSALTPETRAALLAEAHTRMSAYEDALESDLGRFGEIVDRAGLRRDDVLPRFKRSKPFQSKAAPAKSAPSQTFEQARAAAGASDPVKVATPAEAMRLPPGTSILLPDGSLGVVPARQQPPQAAAGASGSW